MEIVLVTRKADQNKGNLAISAAWTALLAEAFPRGAVRTLERAPRYLTRSSLRGLEAKSDPLAAFEETARRLAAMAPGPQAIGAPGQAGIRLRESGKAFQGLRRRLNLRRLAALAGAGQREYRKRLAAFQRSSLVVVNPAGEFHPTATDIALMYLLDVRVAQMLGARTAVVNLTLNTRHPLLGPLIQNVFSRLDLLQLRDEESRQAYAALGGDASETIVAPDMALATPAPAGIPVRSGVVALAINGERAEPGEELDGWVRLVAELQAQGLQVVLVSNAVASDRAYAEQLQARTGIAFVGEGMDVQAFVELLASFELVVTTRMHTAILALAGGRPVVPVQPGLLTKMSGFFDQLGFDEAPVSTRSSGWVEDILARIQGLRDGLEAAEAEVRSRVSDAVTGSRSLLLPRLKAAAGQPHAATRE